MSSSSSSPPTGLAPPPRLERSNEPPPSTPTRAPLKKKRKSRAVGARHKKTLLELQQQALASQEPSYMASLAHLMRNKHLHESDKDPWVMWVLLVTSLLYVYTKNREWPMLVFFVWYFVELIVFSSLKFVRRYVAHHVYRTEGKHNELVLDLVLFFFTLLAAIYVYDFSVFATPFVPPSAWRVGLVVGASLLAGFSRFFWHSLGLLQLTIWALYFTQLGVAGALAVALAASLSVLFIYAWHLRPINDHYIFNAFYGLFQVTLFSALLTGIAINI